MSSKFHNFLNEAKILNGELKAAKRPDPNVDVLIDLLEVSGNIIVY